MNKIKNTSKLIIGFILGAVIFGGLTGMLAYAINATDVSFAPSDNSWEVENVKTALDDLYKTSQSYEIGGLTLESKILMDNVISGERTDFKVFGNSDTSQNSADTPGFYETTNTDDDSTVFYYAGPITNNWVRFGKNGNTCYYWRIIRTNTASEGGGVRLLYSGESTDCSGSVPVITNAYITVNDSSVFPYSASNRQYDNSSYAGYMYTKGEQFGHGTSSYAKQMVDEWYTSKGLSNYSSYINDNAIYCSDRSTTNGQTWTATGGVYGYDTVYRMGQSYINGSWSTISAANPTLKCTNSEDKFSKGTSAGGNGYLSNPIALMTSDELMYAGAHLWYQSYSWYYYASDNSSCITENDGWWTMSPQTFNSGIMMSVVYPASHPGRIEGGTVWGFKALRPVVSLKKSVLWKSGDGSASSPYVIEEI